MNPVGSGDCFAAALALALQRGDDSAAALRLAAGAGAANAASPYNGDVDPALARELAGDASAGPPADALRPARRRAHRERYTGRSMRPILFQFGDFRFYSFGLMAALALIVPGITIVRSLVRRRGLPPEFAYELVIAAGLGGFVGARIYYLVENFAAIKADFWHVAFSGAGFVWYGGLIGGFLGVVGWTLIRRYPLDVVANAMAPAIAMGYAIGRIGCQLAGDGDYGKVSTPALGDGLPERHRAHPARRPRAAHPHLRDHRHELRGLDPLATGDTLRQVRLVDVRLVPRPLRHRALPAWSSCAATRSGSGTSRSRSG